MKPDAKIVMMTGYSVEQLLEQAVNNGAWGILRKPFRMEQVLKMVENLGTDGILIADDDADFVGSIKTLLENHNYAVFVARNGREALERIISNGIDILILDLKMPILNGLETYLELRKVGCVVPTIIVTAYADEYAGDLDRLRSLSVSGILKKPFDPRELLEVVAQISSAHPKKKT
jgi:CheY-like chemotaxis protein